VNQSPADILAAIKASVDKMVEETQAKIALVAATIQGLPARVARIEELLLAVVRDKADTPTFVMSDEARLERDRIAQQVTALRREVEMRADLEQKRKEGGA